MAMLDFDQWTLDELCVGETDVYTVSLEAGKQYRIDVGGGTLAGTMARISPTLPDGPSWRPVHSTIMATMDEDSTPANTLYFTPQYSASYDLLVSGASAGTYAVKIHSPSPRPNTVLAAGPPGSVLQASEWDDLIAMGTFGSALRYTAPAQSEIVGGTGFDTVAAAGAGPGAAWTFSLKGSVPFLDYFYSTSWFSSTPHAYDEVSASVQLRDVEAVETANGLLYTMDAQHANLPRLYAVLGRAPDIEGVAFHHALYESGVPLQVIAGGFMASPEFQGLYDGLDNQGFVAQLYQNVLHRDGEAAGMAYYEQHLADGSLGREAVLIGFAASPENQSLMADYILQV